MQRLAVALFALTACIGPNLISTRDDDNGRGGIVSFHGRENIGYVDARVMQERTDEAIDLARTFCDGGVDVNDRHAEGGENFIDFKCSVAVAPQATKPCAEATPPPGGSDTSAAPAVDSTEAEQPQPQPPPPEPVKKKKHR